MGMGSHIMAYRQSNAALAYDVQPFSAAPAQPYVDPRERAATRPNLEVVAGEGRKADQAVSPAFVHVLKVFCVLIALFVTVGVARVAILTATASTLNANAELSESLDEGRDESANLEVMRSVFSSPTRIRDIASSSFGMVDSGRDVTIDLSDATQADTVDATAADAQ